jgi:uncharacterized membrane protein YvbJ
MALISCPECNKDVSSTAPSCPNCGFGIASLNEQRAAGATLTTVQETSKKLKLHILMSVLAIVIGVVLAIGDSYSDESNPLLFILFLTGGFLWYGVTRFRIWWHHK